jgi:outer membrane protein TolC
MEKLVKLSKKFSRLMKKREKMGRADQVDVASSQAQLVSQEGALLNLKIVKELLEQQITFQLYGNNKQKRNLITTPSLSRSPLSLPASSLEKSLKLATQKRLDLIMLRALLSPSKKAVELAHEQAKPNLSVFAIAAGNGLKDKASDAFTDASDGKNSTITYGLSLDVKFGDSQARAKSLSSQYKIKQTEARISQLTQDIYRDLSMAWLEKSTGVQQNIQANNHISSLKSQRKAEYRKFKQARSGEIGVVRYDMEILSAENERINALENTRLAEAKLRHICHAYSGAK